jgi:hypothetical protein
MRIISKDFTLCEILRILHGDGDAFPLLEYYAVYLNLLKPSGNFTYDQV